MKTIKVEQYNKPPVWAEYGMYLIALFLMVGAIIAPVGGQYIVMAMAALLMYWNYLFFRTMNAYVRFYNASKFNELLQYLSNLEDADAEDGTFLEQDGLTKGELDERQDTDR